MLPGCDFYNKEHSGAWEAVSICNERISVKVIFESGEKGCEAKQKTDMLKCRVRKRGPGVTTLIRAMKK